MADECYCVGSAFYISRGSSGSSVLHHAHVGVQRHGGGSPTDLDGQGGLDAYLGEFIGTMRGIVSGAVPWPHDALAQYPGTVPWHSTLATGHMGTVLWYSTQVEGAVGE